ncbi:outer membrane protein OmpA-like peptidoglycan-associated protein [Rhizobium aquaticum]|uniref:Outer membrane protein OmpA-like peptidoglycan-associated protein n=1 Tax=Rhizobium aquaticum TaxID=1549636 RepID=A0ABV2IV78_9HYPH
MSGTFVRPIAAALLSTVLLAGPTLAKEPAGAKDHPLVGRYAGSEIMDYKSEAFNEQRFITSPINLKTEGEAFTEANSIKVEGKITDIRYNAPKDRSSLEIIRNYEESLKSKGFEVVFSCANETCLKEKGSSYRMSFAAGDGQINYRYGDGVRYLLAKASKPEGDTYAAIFLGDNKTGPLVHVIVADVKPMQSGQIAFVDAGAMAKSITASGHVTLYGIQFDFDKADIKPESRPTLDEIAKFLKANNEVALVVTGHTDGKGGFDYNVDLSKRRAQAVAADLAQHYGISAARLTPFGAGMSSPIASNDDDAGRAKNRRVELVKR